MSSHAFLLLFRFVRQFYELVVVFCTIFLVAPIINDNQFGSSEVQVGNELTLSVNITTFNFALTSITWMHNGNTIISGQDRITITNPYLSASAPVTSTLVRTSAIPFDAGNYTVTATNPAGSGTLTVGVVVTGKITDKIDIYSYSFEMIVLAV